MIKIGSLHSASQKEKAFSGANVFVGKKCLFRAKTNVDPSVFWRLRQVRDAAKGRDKINDALGFPSVSDKCQVRSNEQKQRDSNSSDDDGKTLFNSSSPFGIQWAAFPSNSRRKTEKATVFNIKLLVATLSQ